MIIQHILFLSHHNFNKYVQIHEKKHPKPNYILSTYLFGCFAEIVKLNLKQTGQLYH